jgi:large subunit ribosomal protein L18
MASNSIYTVKYRRKREGKTNYKKRLDLLKGDIPRLVIRKSNSSMIAQIVTYHPDGDKVITTFNSQKLSAFGWNYSKNSLPSAYLSGLVVAQKAKEKGITKAIVDLGLQLPKKGGRLYALLKGAIDGGLSIPVDEKVFPSEERLQGEHIKSFDGLKDIATEYKKNNLDISKLPEVFLSVKKTILGKGE